MEKLIVKTELGNIPKEFCYITEDEKAHSKTNCHRYCEEHAGCTEGCPVQKCFDKLAAYERAHEIIENGVKNIKELANYPHNLTGQMVDDFEWVLSLFEKGNGGISKQ